MILFNKKSKYSWLEAQRLFFYLMHLNCYLALLANDASTGVAIFYIAQLIFFFAISKSYVYLYKYASQLLLNNMLMCLAIGFITLTRLNFSSAVKQFVIVAVISFASLFVPYFISKFKFLKNITWIYAAIGFLGLLAVYAIGSITGGAKLALTIGSFSFQVSEVVKILFVFFVASILTISTDFKNVVVATVIAAAHVGLLVLSTDLGAAAIFFITYLVMLFVATKNVWYLLAGMAAGSFACVLAYKLFRHVRVRVAAWQNPIEVIDNEGYQISQSLFALSGGGWYGEGLSTGMPYKIPIVEKDFIFAAICEELGGVFGICLILICLVNFIVILNIAIQMEQPFYKYVALGLGTTYATQVFLNIGGVIKFIPLTGVTLPLISYGGTSIVCTIITFSLVQGLYSVHGNEKQIKNAKKKSKRKPN